jgi:hypothetical protein
MRVLSIEIFNQRQSLHEVPGQLSVLGLWENKFDTKAGVVASE